MSLRISWPSTTKWQFAARITVISCLLAAAANPTSGVSGSGSPILRTGRALTAEERERLALEVGQDGISWHEAGLSFLGELISYSPDSRP